VLHSSTAVILNRSGVKWYCLWTALNRVTRELQTDRDGACPSAGNDEPGLENHDGRVRAVLQRIKSRWKYSVHELAEEVHLSQRQLQRLFKKETGARISSLLAEQKLQQAVILLTGSSLSIKEIAYATGYEHPSSFTRAFENRFGRSPKDYRRQNDAPGDEKAAFC
jgi:transcriptional regulator GlxA family with amidase domain